MDDLSEEDQLTVARARKMMRFLSQPFQVAEVFTGYSGKLVHLEVGLCTWRGRLVRLEVGLCAWRWADSTMGL